MERYRQTLDEILAKLTTIETDWRDPFADAVLRKLETLEVKPHYSTNDLARLLFTSDDEAKHPSLQKFKPSQRFEAGLTVIRLFLELSKDEFMGFLQEQLGNGGTGIKRATQDRERYLEALEEMGAVNAMEATVNRAVSWVDIITERLKGGRGSAIKGQSRGRQVEDFVEEIVKRVFGDGKYDLRCRFRGATGVSTEKSDFAIPSKDDASILIEAKGYGATGSKQTDVLGDIRRIVEEKRHDTHLLLIADGTTWRARVNDLRKLIEYQNQGQITRIYTMAMADELERDLSQLKKEHGLD